MKTYARIILISCVLVNSVLLVSGQNFIGMHKDRIKGALKQNYPDFRQDQSATNSTYRYLKFVDDISEQTILFFLSENDVCTYIRWISDYSNLNDITGMLDENYNKEGAKRWTYTEGGKRYIVTLEEGEWYFTVNFNEA